jgi:hypothetical protein
MQATNQEILQRLKLWLDKSAAESSAQAQNIRALGAAMQIAAAAAVAGATEQLASSLTLLSSPVADLSSSLGRAFVRGVAEETGQQLRRARRSPMLLAAAAYAATLTLLLVARRR